MYLCVNIYTLKFGPVWVKDLWQSTWCKKRRNVQPSHEQNEKLDHHQNLAHLWSPVDAPPSSKKGRDNKSLHLRTKYDIHSLFILMQIIDHITTISFFFYPLWTIVSFNQQYTNGKGSIKLKLFTKIISKNKYFRLFKRYFVW